MDTSQLPPSATSIIQWAHGQNGHSSREGGCTWALQHELPLTKADLAAASAESWIWHHSPRVISQLLMASWLHWITSPWKGQGFALTEIDIYSGYGFAFPAQTTIHRLQKCLFHHHSIPHSIASDQETHCTANEVHQRAQAHGIHWLYHFLHHPKAAGFTEW